MRTRAWRRLRRRLAGRPVRRSLLVLADSLAWTAAITLAVMERFDFRMGLVDGRHLAVLALLGAGVAVVFCGLVGLYAGRWAVGSHEEAIRLAVADVATTAILFGADEGRWRPIVPRSSILGAGFVALVVMAAGRLVIRIRRDRRLRPVSSTSRMVVFGAGEGGRQSVRAMLRDPESHYLPVGMLDDDPAKRRLRHLGVRVLGGREQIAQTAGELRADSLLIAIPVADRGTIGEITRLGEAAGLRILVLPSLTDFAGPTVDVTDIRAVQIEDLLGRRPVDTDVMAIAGYLTGKRVLVTGAGGSIGSELCRQIANYGPAELIKFDRDESALHALELSMTGRALLDSSELVVGDIRDRQGLLELFGAHRPHVVFHAAALKHLPLLERHPGEAVQTNVWGTANVLAAAAAVGVDHFVNISTDKAADPISVLGFSKRIAERLTADAALDRPGSWVSVRFGNVLGSRGSMLDTFRSQVASGGPITVTSPDVTRFFMTIPEAVQLVIQAGAIGRNGETLVLDMGEAVRIADVAERLAAGATPPVKIVYTGLRPGEKVHEVLLGDGEQDVRPFHPLISHVSVAPLDRMAVSALPCGRDRVEVVAALTRAAAVAPSQRRG